MISTHNILLLVGTDLNPGPHFKYTYIYTGTLVITRCVVAGTAVISDSNYHTSRSGDSMGTEAV